MMRLLLIVLSVVIAVLAFVLDEVWMYWAAGAFLVAAVVVIVTRMWQRYQEAVRFQREEGEPITRHTDLNELGIVEVRPRTDPPASSDPASSDEISSTQEGAATAPSTDAPASAAGSEAEAAPAAAPADPEPTAEPAAERAGEPETAEPKAAAPETIDPVLHPYLEALRAATDSHAACLLVQEDVMLSYRIAAAVSRGAPVHAMGTFETDEPLVTARMTQHAVTVQPVGGGGVAPAQLGYYQRGAPSLEEVAIAPVPTPSLAATYVLLLDAEEAHLQHPRATKIITQFADLLGVLIEAEASAGTPDAPPPELEVAPPEPSTPRPRREIIAEEIEEAARTSSPLALALVHLNRAEGLAEEGAAVVADAEATLRARLERSAPRSRVERFGELTFGVFYNGAVSDVEPWAERLQEEMDRVDGLLAGGVSIGVAMLHDDPQSPEQLRDEATEALRMAYETGTCTIVE